jgi:hypothetical protein
MSREFSSVRTGSGTLLQSGIPKRSAPFGLMRARGLLLRGVVTATYLVDDPNHPRADDEPVAIYCDVLCYSSVAGTRWRFLPHVLVAQDRGAMHSGRVWKPRAATLDVTGSTVDLDKATNPAHLDGDHVIVGFFDDSLNQPVILGGVPHPSADVGNEERGAGHRLRLRQADGDPDFWKHHGALFGIDTDGNFEVDTTFANDGNLQEDGKEQDPPTDGKGSQSYRLPLDAEYRVAFLDMGDPASPEEKVYLQVNKDQVVLKFVDDDTTITQKPDELRIVVQGGTAVIVKDGLIELGSEGAGDKAVLDSLLQTELGRIHDDIATLATEFEKHVHPLPNFVAPLIPLSTSPTIPGATPAPPSMKPTAPPTGASGPGATHSQLVTIDS